MVEPTPSSPAETMTTPIRTALASMSMDSTARPIAIPATTSSPIMPSSPPSSALHHNRLHSQHKWTEVKARSKPMRNLLQRLLAAAPDPNAEGVDQTTSIPRSQYGERTRTNTGMSTSTTVSELSFSDGGPFEIIMFGDKMILDEKIEDWPNCDFLVAFFSGGFPLQKAIDYVRLRRPYCVNDLIMQKLLLDRRMVLLLLDAVSVPTPRRIMVSRDKPALPSDVCRQLQRLHVRPISILEGLEASVAKSSTFRQIDDDTIECGGVIMRKPFVEKPVDGEDHNIWIYFPQSEGGGVRKLFRKVANKSSEFVPDVTHVRTEGSFIYEEFMTVDNAEDVKVYTVGPSYIHAETRKSPVVDGIVRRTAKDGKEMRFVTPLSPAEHEMARKVCTHFGQTVCGLDLLRVGGQSFVIDVNGWSFVKGNNDYYDRCAATLRSLFLAVGGAAGGRRLGMSREPSIENQWQLKSFLAVFRHADRTPKQKYKFWACSEPFFNLLNGNTDEVILRKSEELQMVMQAATDAKQAHLEDSEKMDQLLAILEKKSHYPATKVQIKPSFSKIDGLLDRMLVVVKWGGEFTHAGHHQSRELGENMRKELLLINRALFEDVECYSSSEYRAIDTADVYMKSFLDRESLPSDYIRISKEMLNDSNAAKTQMESAKNRILGVLNARSLADIPAKYPPLPDGTDLPRERVLEVVELLRERRAIMRRKFESGEADLIQHEWCCSESPHLFRERWERIFREFCDVEMQSFDLGKVSELYDSLKYDTLHNRDFMEAVFLEASPNPKDNTDATVANAAVGTEIRPSSSMSASRAQSSDSASQDRHPLRELFLKAKRLFDFVAPQEYGITDKEKLEIGVLTSVPLLNKIVDSLNAARQPTSAPTTRLFFTKESHVHSLFNVIRVAFSPGISLAGNVFELDYLTQITFELYERNRGLGNDTPLEYSLRIGFSPGAHDPGLIDTQMDGEHALSVAPRRWITDHIHLDDALAKLYPKLVTPQVTPCCSPKLQLRRGSIGPLGGSAASLQDKK